MKVSVIIPTHNHAHFLPDSLGSVRAQTYQDYEVIVVNNGSTDNTEEIFKKLAWEKVRYHYQEDTGSVAGPRNTGIKLANGEYVAFLDSDDQWYPDKLEKVMAILDADTQIDILSHDLYMKREGKEKKRIKVGPIQKDMFKALLTDNCLLGSATVVKTNLMQEIGGFDGCREFVHTEDYETWLRIAYLGKKFYFLNEILGEYRVHSSNLSSDFETVLMHEKNVLDKHFRNLKSGGIFYRHRICRIYTKIGVQYFFRKNYKKMAINFARALTLNPISFLIHIHSLWSQARNK